MEMISRQSSLVYNWGNEKSVLLQSHEPVLIISIDLC